MAREMEGARASLRVQRGGSGGGGRTGKGEEGAVVDGCSREGGGAPSREGMGWMAWVCAAPSAACFEPRDVCVWWIGRSARRISHHRIGGATRCRGIACLVSCLPKVRAFGLFLGILDAPAAASPNNPSSVLYIRGSWMFLYLRYMYLLNLLFPGFSSKYVVKELSSSFNFY